jgi:MgtC family
MARNLAGRAGGFFRFTGGRGGHAARAPHAARVRPGGLLGYQRERQGKEAGLRTHMFVALGSASFVVIPLQAGMSIGDLSRVLQGLIAGIGFLLAGESSSSRPRGRFTV